MRLSGLILKAAGWKVEVQAPDFDKCLICVAPHTSNWDFVIGILAYWSVGRKAGFLMKEDWFFFPLGYLFRSLGGIAVPRKRKRGSLVDAITEKFAAAKKLHIAITPEGTRSRTTQWHTGFLQIAKKADIPIILAAIDFAKKEIYANDVYYATGDTDADMRAIKDYYKAISGKHPEKFATE